MRLYYVRNDELCHHGIKGMRWGIRRFQKKDGTLTAAGKKRYSDDDSVEKEKSQHRLKLEKHYRDRGMSPKEAEDAAEKRIKTERILAVTAGITVAAASAYVINKHVKERADGIIKSGTKLQRVTGDADIDLDRAFYTSYGKSDNTKYRGIYGGQLRNGPFGLFKNDVYKVDLSADDDIRVVSRDKAAEVFKDLYKNDPEFRKSFKESNSIFDTGGLVAKRDRVVRIASGDMTDRQLKRAGYDAFNIGLANHDDNGSAIASKFYDRLKSMGYDAVADINDQKYSGYNSKSPVIVFNRGKKISIADIQKMTEEQIKSDEKKAYANLFGTELLKSGTKTAGAMLAGTLATRTYNEVKVNNYRAEHPNSGMTDEEILRKLSGYTEYKSNV